MAAPPPVGAHGKPLDVAGAERAAAVQKTALYDRRVPHELAALPDERVDAAERVVPVRVAEVAVERGVEQPPRGGERRGVEVGGVGRTEVQTTR